MSDPRSHGTYRIGNFVGLMSHDVSKAIVTTISYMINFLRPHNIITIA